jgi:hypothetical protein
MHLVLFPGCQKSIFLQLKPEPAPWFPGFLVSVPVSRIYLTPPICLLSKWEIMASMGYDNGSNLFGISLGIGITN